MDNTYEQLLQGNRDYVEKITSRKPDFFSELAKGQSPEVLWIGCSDSVVPANTLTGTRPGDVFVHRNLGNLCVHTDMNMLSVLDFAVNVLKVKHIIVTGHYGCTAIPAAMGNLQFAVAENWLFHIKSVYRLHAKELDAIADEKARADRLVELNVREQLINLCRTHIVQNAWRERTDFELHGWVIDIKTGLVKDLGITLTSSNKEGENLTLDEEDELRG
ncbi:MAG: carbonate dehydratase [Sphingobacteriaceae bacterium]|jgi:carbonic anhydrase|nr:carbonate dehydratase [Sphingobacteriaceae bacterium]